MNIFHLSAECYPAAKVGGLADVVGALPIYLQQLGTRASVVIPKYDTPWIADHSFETVYEGELKTGQVATAFSVQKSPHRQRKFPFYVVDIPSYFNRPGIYGDPASGIGYEDEAERFISFQTAALQWIQSRAQKPDIIHCHDHHTALVPFMINHCYDFASLASIPTVLTVHNAEYQGCYSHEKEALLPDFDHQIAGLLDWNGQFNSLAAGLKCCSQITTVSPSYMQELQQRGGGLELLFAGKKQKSCGILNGIDETVWNPQTDDFLPHHYSVENAEQGKRANKLALCRQFGFDKKRPLISFIGRLVGEKGADLLPDLFTSILEETKDISFLVLGTGDPQLQSRFRALSNEYIGYFDASLNYNEQLAHQIYAGSDFLIMPSRVEPCGLNQLYAMRYGTMPIVRNTGGLKDTVRDVGLENGYGITFQKFDLPAAQKAIQRALALYNEPQRFQLFRKELMKLDFSWNVSARSYIEMYKQIRD